ncbi:hypothetical protein MYP_3937 [Sporocytophaga myxococcoides]|uniref:Uncharacterized protein n=1 Tax=Sporocytophaga myxococcoides TaxID=153721 RepID=A0A098LJT4_9BACT|nr:hypothetical protein [Sporocytophaga myxococcoides]GAL86707.1 hypothetical protein MYP_3937 [Sporocytophaga myxococcoides]
MKDKTNHLDNTSRTFIKPIYKERWVSIAVRYDEFSRFALTFVIPFKKHLHDKFSVSFFYHRMGSKNNVIQLNFVTSPYYFQREIKPFLIQLLNTYFGKNYLQSHYGVDHIDSTMCEHKLGLDGIDLVNLKLFSTEDLYTSPITYSIGVQGGKAVSEFLSVSSGLLLSEASLSGRFFHCQECIEKAMSFNLIFICSFIPDKNSHYQFLSWVIDTMLIQLNNKSVDILAELEVSYFEQKEQLSAYMDYIGDTITSGEIFEDDWMNIWTDACRRYKTIIDTLSESGKLTMPYDVKDNPTIHFPIDNKTYQDWQIAYFMVSSINGQMEINFNTELNILFWLKRTLQELNVIE